MEIISRSRFVHHTPDKLRLLSNICKNGKIDDTIAKLQVSGKSASKSLILVLKQAKNQIKDKNVEVDNFSVREIRIDEGPKLKRRRIRHQGRATAILKRQAHITLVLRDDKAVKGSTNGTKS